MLLVINFPDDEFEYDHLRVIRLKDGANLHALGLPFSRVAEAPAFVQDSFHLSEESGIGIYPVFYKPGIDRVITLLTVHSFDKAFTVIISVKQLLLHITF